ncbi:hypothetical protein BH09BAC1_BH09BAC1_17190 [soil metagenome]
MGQLNTDTYYQTLGVQATATDDAIKAAYRKLVLRYHPDKSTAPEAVAIFTRIQKAYEVLSHPALREMYDRQLALNADVADHYFHVPTRFTSRLIAMHVSTTHVRAGEPFTIIFRCPRRLEGFKLRGLEHFELLKSVEHEMPYQGEIITQVHYVLRTLEEGSFRLGPASAISGTIEYISGETTITAQGAFQEPTWAQRNWFQKYYPVVLILVAIMLPALIFYNISVYGIKQPGSATERLYPFGEPKNRLDTGASPYQSALETGQIFNGQVLVKNRLMRDAVFILLDDDQVIKHNHFVRAGDTYTIDHIPTGTYQWVVLSGDKWDAEKASPIDGYFGNFINGTTIGNVQAGLPEWSITEKEANNTIFYTIYKLELKGKKGEETLSIETDTGFYILN